MKEKNKELQNNKIFFKLLHSLEYYSKPYSKVRDYSKIPIKGANKFAFDIFNSCIAEEDTIKAFAKLSEYRNQYTKINK